MMSLSVLRERFNGELVVSSDPGYDARRALWNRMIDRRPALIARVADVEDTRRALAYARERELPIAIRGGGHNVAGTALVDTGVVIDNSLRRRVRVDMQARRVEVEPGVLLGELDAATHLHGLVVPSGINTTTGIAGLTLGGGIGWLMRAYGLTCDHLVEADVVSADGSLVTVDSERQPDLLWALRGGGGNFGIVTRFAFRAESLDGPVLAGLAFFPMEDGRAVLRRYREWLAELPRAVTTIVALRTVLPLPAMPSELHGRRVVGIGLCSVAGPEQDETIRRGLLGLGRALLDTVGRKPFTAHQALFDPSVPAGHGYYWKSHFLDELTDAAIDVLVDQHLAAPQPWSYSLIGHLGGAIGDVPADGTAYANRDARHVLNINGVAEDPADDGEVIAWTRACFEAMTPFSTGGVYVNFMGDEGQDRVRAAYGRAYELLTELKGQWDPDNVFRANQNIRPAVRA